MYKVLLFAGTIEGRTIAEALEKLEVPSLVFVATEYGESLIHAGECVKVESGRLTMEEMKEKMNLAPDAVVIDATHPYAQVVTANIRLASEETSHKYIRVLRKSTVTESERAVFVESPQKAAEYLNTVEGKVLLTTGSKELAAFTAVNDFENRLFARVLSLPNVAQSCADLGFKGSHLICMQGPFSTEMNVALLHQTGASYLVTKDTGVTGGFPEKKEACLLTDTKMIVIGRPVEETGISVEECIQMFGGQIDMQLETEQEIAVIGIGMGGENNPTLTISSDAYIKTADLLVGAARMVDALPHAGKAVLYEYRPKEIAAYIAEHKEYKKAAVLLSGDVGFFSGAKKLLNYLPENTEVMPGIGSMVYFCAKLHLPWEDVKITSNHGRISNMIGLCNYNQKVFSLLGKEDDVRNLCKKFVDYGMQDVTVHVGEKFCYPDEKIVSGKPEDFLTYAGESLSVVLVENAAPCQVITHGIPDEAFLRDKVPMTKEEVREISISKMRLHRDSIIYDIGAGSGSVSVEMALTAIEGQVFAVEKNSTAVALLHENKKKFRADNLEIVEGLAPDAMQELPAPTHAFIGGSSGNLKEILELLLKKNPNIRVVINAITLETIGESVEALKVLPFEDVDIASVNVSKAKELGRYHLMFAQNPVYVISATGSASEEKE